MATLLDTKVLSELRRAEPSLAVLACFAAQPAQTLLVSAVAQAEMVLGSRALPAVRRRAAPEGALQATFDEDSTATRLVDP